MLAKVLKRLHVSHSVHVLQFKAALPADDAPILPPLILNLIMIRKLCILYQLMSLLKSCLSFPFIIVLYFLSFVTLDSNASKENRALQVAA